MTINTTWSVSNMTHNDADGGVILVYWQCIAGNVTGQTPDGVDQYDYTAVESGKLRCDPDPSADGFVAYDDLTESIVLDWVYDSLVEGDETPAEAKARVEANRTAKVQGQITRNSSSGKPW